MRKSEMGSNTIELNGKDIIFHRLLWNQHAKYQLNLYGFGSIDLKDIPIKNELYHINFVVA
jgi:hypothetical protein